MSITISTVARNAAGTAVADLINQGSINPNGYIEIRTGSKPASLQAPATGTVLATLPMSLPAFSEFANGRSVANPIASDTNIAATGTAGWFRVYDRDNFPILDGRITATGGGGDLEFDTIHFVVGGTVIISNITIVVP